MHAFRVIATVVVLGAFAASGFAADRTDGALAGRVTGPANPLSTARVYAYQTGDLKLHKVLTDHDGVFLFERLPAGLYKIIALKPGFMPAVIVLTRTTAQATQFLEVELSHQSSDPREAEASFWTIREKIPTDVLRDLDQPILVAESTHEQSLESSSFKTEMGAVSGVHESIDAGSAQVNGARVGVAGQIGNVAIDFDGQFSELASHRLGNTNQPSGTSQEVYLAVEPNDRSSVSVASRSSNLVTFSGSRTGNVDFERHRVSWSQAVGQKGQSSFSAQYTEESNFYRQALIRPGWIPSASRSWQVEGSYSTSLGSRSNLQAGLRFNDRDSDYNRIRRGQPLLARESVELFGQGDLALNGTFVVQYGLYSAMRDGGLSLAPQGGLIINLGQNWQASTLASKRLEQAGDEFVMTDFTPTYFGDAHNCRQDAIYCYQLEFMRSLDNEDRLSFGAVHRKIGETQRLYFDGDFLDRLDSLYLVEGDQLPELRGRTDPSTDPRGRHHAEFQCRCGWRRSHADGWPQDLRKRGSVSGHLDRHAFRGNVDRCLLVLSPTRAGTQPPQGKSYSSITRTRAAAAGRYARSQRPAKHRGKSGSPSQHGDQSGRLVRHLRA